MRYVTLALWAEGPSDRPFLQPLLRRLVTEHVLKGRQPVEVSEDFISLPDVMPQAGRDIRIGAAVAKRRGEISLLFIHSDGKGDPKHARLHNVTPAITKIAGPQTSPPRCVAVIPVHETEAWMLADAEALADAMGVNPAYLTSLPPIDALERHPDPKQCLGSIRTSMRRSSRRVPVLDLRPIGEAVRFEHLRRLESFRSLEGELLAALGDMRLL